MNPLDQVNAFSGILPANGQASPGLIAQKRRLAEAMFSQGTDASPIASPWQGAARLAQAYVGGSMMNKANQMDIQGHQDAAAKLSAAMQPNATPADMSGALASPFIDPSTVVGMANSNRQFNFENNKFKVEQSNNDRNFAQNKIQQDREFALAGYKPVGDGTYRNIMTGQVVDMYGGPVGGSSNVGAGAAGQTTAQPIPAPITTPQMPPGAPQADPGSNPAAAAPAPAQAGPIPAAPPAASAQPANAYAAGVAWARKNGLNPGDPEVQKLASQALAHPEMSLADLTNGEKFRAEVTGAQPYVNMQEGTAALQAMQASLNDSTPASDAAFMHAFVQSLTPSKVIKNSAGQNQNVGADPENIQAAWQKAKSYLTGEGRLEPAQKQEMMRTAYGQVKTYKGAYDALMASEGGVAKNAGVHLDKVVPGLGDLPKLANDGPPDSSPLGQARAAIDSGADPEAVKKRLAQHGIDPSGL